MNMSSLALLLLVSSAAVVNADCTVSATSPVTLADYDAVTDCVDGSTVVDTLTTCTFVACADAGEVMLASDVYTCTGTDFVSPTPVNGCEFGCAAFSAATALPQFTTASHTAATDITLHGGTATLECDAGYIQVNDTMDATVTCDSAVTDTAGTWAATDDDGACVSGCAALADEELVQFTTASLALSTGTSLTSATVETLVCASGYIQVDEAVNVTATCTASTGVNGSWAITADDGACVFGCPSISSGTWTAYNSTQTALATSTKLPGATVTTVNSCNTGYSQANATLDMTFTCASNTTGTLGSYTVTNGCVSDTSESSDASSVAPVFALGALLMARLL